MRRDAERGRPGDFADARFASLRARLRRLRVAADDARSLPAAPSRASVATGPLVRRSERPLLARFEGEVWPAGAALLDAWFRFRLERLPETRHTKDVPLGGVVKVSGRVCPGPLFVAEPSRC